MPNHRRVFLVSCAAGAAALTTSARAQAVLDEKDPQAIALGYVADAKKVDPKKYPKYAAGQLCSNCSLYQAKPTDPVGGCALFGTNKVAGKGWCSAWVKKG